MVQTITRKFPDPGPAMNRVRNPISPTGWINVPVLEIERRENHLRLVTNTHPMYSLAVDCLKDTDTERPSAQQICHRLSALKEAPQYGQSLEAREGGERNGDTQERDQLIQQLRQENEEKEREVRERERENEILRDELQRKEEERRQVEDELRDEIHELRESISSNACLLQEKEQEKDQLHRELQEKDATIHQLQQFASYTCQVSGPGLQSATANHPTHVLVELSDSSGRPCSLQQNVTAELKLISKATPTSGSRWPWSKKTPAVSVRVTVTSPSRYEVSYTAVSRGQHTLHVRVNDREINGSPFTMTMYPDPTQLGRPVRIVAGLNYPYGIAFNSQGEMIIAEHHGHQISVFDNRGQRIQIFSSCGNRPEQMEYPAGVAIDDTDNIYVSSNYKLQKFTGSGELIKCVGQRGSKEGELNDPRGVALYDNQVYVCDRNNHRIQVFDLDLNFIRSIGSHGKGRGELYKPFDVKFDTAGNMYIVDYWNERVQVIDSSGHFQEFGLQGEGKLRGPSSIVIADKYVYVSDLLQCCISVYETSGQFVTSFGRCGHKEGEFDSPFYITSCTDGYIYASDFDNNRVQIF